MKKAKQAIRAEASALGFDAVAFCAAVDAPDDEANRRHLKAYLARGNHGSMEWMAETAGRRSTPTALWPEAQNIIVLGVNYGPEGDPRQAHGDPAKGAVSVYAQGHEYQDVIKKRLKHLARWMVKTYACQVKVFVDTAPVMEKPLAARAGLGWQGKHTCLVSPEFGSWLFLAEIFTTLELEPDKAGVDRCGSCRACIDACPTGALYEPYRLDARRCISCLTIEHKDSIDLELAARMGNRVFGCDDCLAACPWNKFATPTGEGKFQPREGAADLSLAELATLDDAAFRRRFAKSPLKRTGRDRMVRNALIAVGNSGDPSLAKIAEKLLNDDSALVREAAERALERF
ncbi:MAG: tRNA epoxyqueuosine(34) reductase QueG [Rhodospirillales bacterium RIFCSPLOWO2_12_FULL_58_28]|nr:MAG: tRNA epoxyqueuosine(34) reductase QueG [Rhodospirillales bacterium RIFCSPLOWO2_02_FULL_58_16]OHC77325.1 MAG: tRNA epoxyqueuosine(34) reductase QueG [Rhodospirillales bacterium RIFCSPLOWO2_12_FULL_58_28]